MASTPVALWVVVAAVLGLAVGSFLNVVIHRAPLRMSLSTPGSHCPRCGTPIRARHNVPVFGWLVLRGRCADCAAPISPRYPLVEAATAVLFAAVTWPLAGDHLAYVPAALWLVAAAFTALLIVADRARPSPRFLVVSVAVLVVLLGFGLVLD